MSRREVEAMVCESDMREGDMRKNRFLITPILPSFRFSKEAGSVDRETGGAKEGRKGAEKNESA